MQLDDFSCKWHQSVDCERLTVQAQKGGTRGSRAAHIAVNERMVERDPVRQCCCLPRQVCACVVGRGMGAVHRRFGRGAAPASQDRRWVRQSAREVLGQGNDVIGSQVAVLGQLIVGEQRERLGRLGAVDKFVSHAL